MSSLFKRSFHSKQLKEFTDLSIKAIPSTNRETAKSIYKSIKNKTNEEWTAVPTALDCLQQMHQLIIQISVYRNIMNNKKKNKPQIIKSAKSHLAKLLSNSDTKSIINALENGFNLSKNSLLKTEIPHYKIPPSPLHRKRKRANTNSEIETNTKTFFKNNKNNYRTRRDTLPLPENTYIKPIIKPNINTKEQLDFYLERALTNKLWNENDAEILCKTAINMKCNWITVHSIWVQKCYQLLHKYSVQTYKNDLKLYKKSKRRGYKKINNFKIYSNENDIISNTKICVAVGYPFGQTSTATKVSETTQAIIDGAQRISLMLYGGKILSNDWEYIKNEIQSVMDVINGTNIEIDIAFPQCTQITENVKAHLNKRILNEIMNVMKPTAGNGIDKEGVSKYKSESDSEEESKQTDSGEKLSFEVLKQHNNTFEYSDSSDNNEPEPMSYSHNRSHSNDNSSFWDNESKQSVQLEHNINGSQLMDDDFDDMDIIMETLVNKSVLSTASNTSVSNSSSSHSKDKLMKVLITNSYTENTPDPGFEPGSPLHMKHKKKKKKRKKRKRKRKLNENKSKKTMKTNFKNKSRKYKPKKIRKKSI